MPVSVDPRVSRLKLAKRFIYSLTLVCAFVLLFEGGDLIRKISINLLALKIFPAAPHPFLEKGRNLETICPIPLSNTRIEEFHCSTGSDCFLHGILALNAGDWSAAQDDLSSSRHYLSHYFQGWVDWCSGKPDQAIQDWSQDGPALSNSFQSIGEDFLLSNDPKKAIPWLTLANDLQPESSKTLMLIGDAYGQEGNLESAADYYGMAISTGSAPGAAYTKAAEVAYGLGRIVQAKKYILTAIQLDPNGWLNWQILGNILLLDENDPSEAEVWYRKVISSKPDYALAHATLSMALLKQSRLEESLRSLLEAMRLVPDLTLRAEYLENWIQSARNIQDPGEIVNFLEQRWENDPANIELLALLVRGEYVSGQCQEAGERYKQLETLALSRGVDLPVINRTCSNEK